MRGHPRGGSSKSRMRGGGSGGGGAGAREKPDDVANPTQSKKN
jgi:hypothetical protein